MEALAPIIVLGLFVLIIASLWGVFAKAGKPGWACIIPIYNVVVLLEIAGRPIWWLILMFIPLVSMVVAIVIALDIANKFGKSSGFGLGLAFLPFIFYPLLAFGDAKYRG